MADKKLSNGEIIFWLIIISWLLSVFSCASQSSREDSNHYRAQIQQGYPCPGCEFSIPDKDVSTNIRVKNKCPSCQKIFFGAPVAESVESESQDKSHQGPSVLVRGYHSDIKHENNTEYKVKNSWDVGDDGNSGSISSTTIIKHEHTRKEEYGRIVGPAGLGRYGGY